MSETALLDPAPARPLWLMTLADLALLLLGFMVLVQSLQPQHRDALVRGLQQRFASAPVPTPIPVAAAAAVDFAPGSAALPGSAAALLDWVRVAARDPRISLTITGAVDGSPADIDPATASGPLLAADRARAIGALLVAGHAIAPGRLTITTAARPGRRAVTVAIAFTGAPRP